MAKVTIKYSETTREQRREIFRQMRRDDNRAEGLKQALEEMRKLEDRYGMSTLEFYAQFTEGKMGDCSDFIRWAGAFRAYQKLLQEKSDETKRHKKAA